MGVKPGYKQTEVGEIPEDWEVRPLVEHFRIYAGGDVPKNSLSQTRSTSHPYPLFANAIQADGLYGYTNETRSAACSLTITARGYLGHAVYRSEPFFPIVRLLVLEPTGQLDAKFTTYAVNERVEFAIESTGVPQLTAPQVGKYSVAAPATLPEQRAIAAALSDVDAALAGVLRLIAKKRDLKQAAMQILLTGRTRLPGFSAEWKVKRLGELLQYEQPTKYLVSDSEYSESYDTPVLTAGKTFILGKTNETHGLFCDLPAIIFDDFTTSIQFVDFPFKAKSSAMKILSLKSAGNQISIVYEIMKAINFVMSDHKRYWISEYQHIKIRLPDPIEQTALAAVLSDMDAEIAALTAQAEKTRLLKQAILQELLTGRTRLPIPEDANA